MNPLSARPPATGDKPDAKAATGLAAVAADTRGATLAEYAFLLLIVVAAVALGLTAVGASTSSILTKASTSI